MRDMNRHIGASNNFKLAVVIVLILITGFHIFTIYTFPEQEIISDKILLGVALAMLSYLWIQEIKDRQAYQIKCVQLVKAQKDLEESNLKAILRQ